MATKEIVTGTWIDPVAEFIEKTTQQNGFLPDKDWERLQILWQNKAFSLPPQQKNEIGLLWLRKILHLDERTIDAFVHGSRLRQAHACYRVGRCNLRRNHLRPDPWGFWQGVDRLCPDFLSKEDLDLLAREDKGGLASWRMLCTFKSLNPTSPVISRIIMSRADYQRDYSFPGLEGWAF